MKTFVRLGATTALVLLLPAFSRGQNYDQINLVSNASGVAPVTERLQFSEASTYK